MKTTKSSRRTVWIVGAVAAMLVFLVQVVWMIAGPFGATRQFVLRDMVEAQRVPGNVPVATFERPRPRSSLSQTRSIGSQTRIWVFRLNKWRELEASEVTRRVALHPAIFEMSGGRRFARDGYTLEVNVPVCDRWRIEEEIWETRRIGFKRLGFDISITNRWQSAELPGWSEVRGAFNRELALH